MINPLEPKSFGEAERDETSPEPFRKVTRLSQHISYLKDFFRAYKGFSDSEIDTIEIMLMKLYAIFDIDDLTDFNKLKPTDYPVMQDLYDLIEKEFMIFDHEKKHLYTEETLQNICLGLHSMCKGAESKYFNGHTNIKDSQFLCFGVKGLMDTNKRLKDTLLFNILSYMSNQLLGVGNTVAAIDELYLFLTNLTAIEYIRNAMKRVRKKESAMVCATPCVVPVAEKYTTSVLPVVVTVLVASEEAAALDAASLEATEELLTLLAELPEQEASSRAAADAPATCKNWRREILFFIRNTPLSM